MAASLIVLFAAGRAVAAMNLDPRPDVAQAIVAGYLADDAHDRRPEDSSRVCVMAALRPPLEREREERGERGERHERHDWVRPGPPEEASTFAQPLPWAEALDRKVDRAAAAIRPSPPFARRIHRRSVPASIILSRQWRCPANISLTAPVVVGDTAFVEANFDRGGSIYALERRGGHWQVIASSGLWIAQSEPPR